MSFYKHPQALCETRSVGTGTRIWAFAHVLEGAVIGDDCNICDHTFIENDVTIGDRVTVKSGVQLWDGIRVQDDAFIGPNVTFSNDVFPRSKVYPEKFLETIVCKKASIGAGSTILPGLTIGRNAMVGAGSVVTRSVPPNAIVVGNPARIIGYVDSLRSQGEEQRQPTSGELDGKFKRTSVEGVNLHRLSVIKDMRGILTVGEFEREVPFIPKRYFMVFDVPSARIRGEHAHRECHQFLICVKGSCAVVADDGKTREEFFLGSPAVGIHIPHLVWATQYKYSPDAVLLVFASQYYDPEDYIRDYDEFMTFIAGRS
jgi:UDP-2-acetamido-3-amino-2,3-dideoxy-glucuronate N-acetyltransferase